MVSTGPSGCFTAYYTIRGAEIQRGTAENFGRGDRHDDGPALLLEGRGGSNAPIHMGSAGASGKIGKSASRRYFWVSPARRTGPTTTLALPVPPRAHAAARRPVARSLRSRLRVARARGSALRSARSHVRCAHGSHRSAPPRARAARSALRRLAHGFARALARLRATRLRTPASAGALRVERHPPLSLACTPRSASHPLRLAPACQPRKSLGGVASQRDDKLTLRESASSA